ncbi:MAG: aminopeptidase P family N-terminal domain-containing protein [Erysipelotrichaceae bacterium]|nr:aminopeptidase P family N-terminal domain-containing protein [Erysipelotrichaceae bacterium]
MIKERLAALRKQMKELSMDAYYIPTADFHESEYVCEYFTCRKYMSGFTGSAGVMVVTMDHAGLWTDGRYFIQAENQLKDTTVTLYRMGQEGVPTVTEFLQGVLQEGMCLGFDGRVVNSLYANQLKEALPGVNFAITDDVVGKIWTDRPGLPDGEVYILEEKWSGESCASKLNRVREEMKNRQAEYHVLTTLDDICWVLNVRGTDSVASPVVLSYALIGMDTMTWYVNEKKVPASVREALAKDGVEIRPYNDIYEDMKTITETVLYDPKKVNYALSALIKNSVCADNPEVLMKAIKNETEIANLRQCHIMDGVAVTKFIYWLKHEIQKREITEWEAAEKLSWFRAQNENCFGGSFGTIGAYNANAAMMHYSPSKDKPVYMKNSGMYLVDSGGQYWQGSTDITRTILLGDICDLWKDHYTRVVRGMIGISKAQFLYGCRGLNLDILARGPVWDIDIDYQCGTGHGVGYLLNIHEAPNGFRWRIVPERNDSCVMEAGMVTTIEPGVYIENSHGIRVENEVVCEKRGKNEYGQFMGFETLTVCPIDLDAILPEEMTKSERKWLNDYHAYVYKTLLPFMNEEEATWLQTATRSI